MSVHEYLTSKGALVKNQNQRSAPAFQHGDRVRMISGCVDQTGNLLRRRMLRGIVVESWGRDGLVVVWDDWPCMTALPNPNVEHDDG